MNSIDNGVAFLIRLALVGFIFCLSSCSSMSNFDGIYNSVKNSLTSEVISPTELAKLNIKNDLIITIDDKDEKIASISENNQYWNLLDGVSLTINKGKVTKTIGLEYDFQIFNYKGFKDLKLSKSRIEFINPSSGYMEIEFKYSYVEDGFLFSRIQNKEIAYRLYREDFNVDLISWEGSNYYWVDGNDNVILSKQVISPYGNKIRISQ